MKKIFLCILCLAFIVAGCSANPGNLTLQGDIQNNIISAISTVSGKIIKMNKQQGELVKRGDIIAVIDNTNQKYVVDQLQAIVNMKKAKLEELQAGARPQQIAQAEAQVRAAKEQLNGVSIAQKALSSAQITYDYVDAQYKKTLTLYKEGALSKDELDKAKYKSDTAANQLSTAKYQLENAKMQFSAARANYDAANAQLDLLQSGATKQTINAAQADFDQAVAQLNQARNTLNNCNIVALEDGIIISKNFELGDVVNVGSNIADIAVTNGLYVLSYIPDEYLDKIYYNQSLAVTTAIGVQTGKVSYIALKHEYTPKDKQSTSDSKHMATKIKVTIKDNKGRLKSGMSANIEVPLK